MFVCQVGIFKSGPYTIESSGGTPSILFRSSCFSLGSFRVSGRPLVSASHPSEVVNKSGLGSWQLSTRMDYYMIFVMNSIIHLPHSELNMTKRTVCGHPQASKPSLCGLRLEGTGSAMSFNLMMTFGECIQRTLLEYWSVCHLSRC